MIASFIALRDCTLYNTCLNWYKNIYTNISFLIILSATAKALPKADYSSPASAPGTLLYE